MPEGNFFFKVATICKHIKPCLYSREIICLIHVCKRVSQTDKVQFSSVAQLCPTLCNPMNRSMPGLPVHHQLLEFTQTHVHRVGDAIQPSHPCRPLLLPPSIFPSLRVFSNESTLCIRWPKYWSFSFNISPSNEHPGLISFRMDWLDILAVQETLKSLLQHHSSKTSILRCSAFFIVQLSNPYMTIGKTNRDQTHAPSTLGAWSLNHWTARELPLPSFPQPF